MRPYCHTMICLMVALTGLSAEPSDRAVRDLLDQSEIHGGLVVHVGCGEGNRTIDLCVGDQYLVQGLDPDAAKVVLARERAAKLDLDGRVTFDVLPKNLLPYIDNIVNLLIVDEIGLVSAEEIQRVLAPGGVSFVKQDDGWSRSEKPRPAEIDQWTHYLHGPDNNAVARDTVIGAPRHIQWLAAPQWTRSHHKLNSVSAAVASGRRLFCILDDATAANINVPSRWVIVARDAFSGVTLWKKPMASWAWHLIRFRSGPAQVTRLLVTDGDRVYAPLGLNSPVSAMDAATGETQRTYEATAGAEEVILIDDTLLVLCGAPVAEQTVSNPAFRDRNRGVNQKTLVAVDLKTGDTLWTWCDPDVHPMPETLASDGEAAYIQIDEGVACLDLESGSERWRYGDLTKEVKRSPANFGKSVLVVSNGVVLCNLQGQLTALSGKSGERLWECWGGGGFHAPPDVFVIDGLVWQGLHTADSISPPPVQDFNEGRDLRTGEVKRTNTVAVDLQTPGHHHRCYREKATERFIITGKRGIEMMDLTGDQHSRNNWVRGTCQYGILPANGLIYSPPHSCGCYMESKLRGFWALSTSQPTTEDPARCVSGDGRLEKGPAYGKTDGSTHDATQDAWPVYRHDSLRSGVASTTVPTDLQQAWSVELGGSLAQAVVSEGFAIVTSIDAGSVCALDAETGRKRWEHIAGGRIDSPPAIYKGMVLFGCSDGRVTCLRLRDGQLVWRFLAAPAELRTVAFDRVESVWPVHGSVLLLNGVAYCTAGRSTWLDGGISLYGLDPMTGRVICETRFQSRHPEFGEGKAGKSEEHVVRVDQNLTDYKTFLETDRSDAFSMAGGAVSDVLVSDGWNVYLHHAKFDADLQPRSELSRHLFSTSSLLDDSENHRSHWVLGTGDFSRIPVAYSWIANRPGKRMPTIAVPVGVQMVFEPTALWGVRTQGDTTGKYLLFQAANKPFSQKEESLADFRTIPQSQVNAYQWSTQLPRRTTAMLKSGDHLFLGTSPIEIPDDDPQAAYDGRLGGSLWVGTAEDGEPVAEHKLPSPPAWDGVSAAGGRLFVATRDGKLQCFAGNNHTPSGGNAD